MGGVRAHPRGSNHGLKARERELVSQRGSGLVFESPGGSNTTGQSGVFI